MVARADDVAVIWSAVTRHRFDMSRSDGFRRPPPAVNLEVGYSVLFGLAILVGTERGGKKQADLPM